MEVKLKFFYGAMGCGKTRKMQGDYYSKIEDGFNAIIIKPLVDKKADRDTLARDGSKFRAEFLIDKEDNIYDIIAEYLIDNNLRVSDFEDYLKKIFKLVISKKKALEINIKVQETINNIEHTKYFLNLYPYILRA